MNSVLILLVDLAITLLSARCGRMAQRGQIGLSFMTVMIEKNIDCFIDMMKRSVDTALANKNSSRYESVYKFFKVTVSTGNDLLKLYAHEGMTQEEYPEDEIFNCDPDRVFVFYWNH